MRLRAGKPQHPASDSTAKAAAAPAAVDGSPGKSDVVMRGRPLPRGPATAAAASSRLRTILRILLSVTSVVALLALAANHFVSEFVLHDALCHASAWVAASDDVLVSDAQAFSHAVENLRAHPFGTLRYNRSMYWGTYRPNVLVGVKNRNEDPLLFGMAWYDTSGRLAPPRHETVESNALLFRWDLHDGRYFGRQIIVDDELHLRLEVDFVKVMDGTGWDLRVSVTRQGSRYFPLTLVTYFAHEGGAVKFPLTVHDRRKMLEALNETERVRETPFYSAADAMQAAPDSVGVSGAVHSYSTAGGGGLRGIEQDETESGSSVTDRGATSAGQGAPPLLVPFTAIVSDETPQFANRSASWRVHEFTLAAGSSWQFDVRNTPSMGPSRNHPLVRDSSQRHQSPRYGNRHNVVVFKKDFTSDFRVHVALRETSNVAGTSRHTHHSYHPSNDRSAHPQPQPPQLGRNLHQITSHWTPCQLTRIIASRSENVRRRFEAIFGGHAALAGTSKGGTRDTASDYLSEHRDAVLHMATSAVSNMIGGMGYWRGTYRVVSAELDELSDSRGAEVKLPPQQGGGEREVRDPVSLFSAVPSRAKLPRGFLWDEGFHQLLLSQWDMEMSKDVIAHWLLSVADPTTGWIPREQILGTESRSRVPSEFVAQHPLHANPPALVLVLQDLAMSNDRQPSDVVFLRTIQPRLALWRNWFYREQCGGLANCSAMPRPYPPVALDETLDSLLRFRWRSRNQYHLLASGLDDYPRPVCVGKHRRELHVDLFSWMALMATTIDTIDDIVGAHPDHHRHHHRMRNEQQQPRGQIDWEAQLTRLHWDVDRRRFADVTGCARAPITTSGSTAEGRDPTYEQAPRNQAKPSSSPLSATDQAKKKAHSTPPYFSPYDGYVNLFPLLTMLLEDRDKISAVLSLAETELMTPFGLMSVSNASRGLLASTGLKHENYWTGPIWININYLFLRALKLKYNERMGEQAVTLYTSLRERLIRNVHAEFMRTGKLWENYHWQTGRGQGTAPFTGWTALIVAIIGERY